MKRVFQRILWAFVVIWAVTTLTFVVSHVLPSDPARMAAGAQARPKDVEKIRKQLGLDQPMLVQYGRYVMRMVHVTRAPLGSDNHENCGAILPWVHADLGWSFLLRRPVVQVLAERLPRSIALALAAILVQAIIGIGLGVLAARKRDSWIDRTVTGGSAIVMSFPSFLIGIILQAVLAHKLHLLPLDGFGTTLWEQSRSIVLPALTLGIYGSATYVRLVRSELLAALGQDFIRTARAKGGSPLRVTMHALRNAAVPLVTVLALELGALAGGAVVTETLFRWPGIGAISVSSLLDRDGPMLLGTVIVTTLVIVLANAAADLLYPLLDPRLRKRG